MPFEIVVGIDWSGARRPGRKIQVAEYNVAEQTVRLVDPQENRAVSWTRVAVFHYVQQLVSKKVALIGLDFAFAHPFCIAGAYFPGLDESPPDREHLWHVVEWYCGEADDLYGGPFYRDQNSPFSQFYTYPYHPGRQDQEFYRMTDLAAMDILGLNPCSVFTCIGPNQVGPGSIAGMRFLLRVSNQTDVYIWPFDVNGPPMRSTMVEIYPRRFLRQAQLAGVQIQANNIRELCAHFGADLQKAPQNPTNDMRDALVSASGMGWLVQQHQYWRVPACAAEYEGWIFGVESGDPAPVDEEA